MDKSFCTLLGELISGDRIAAWLRRCLWAIAFAGLAQAAAAQDAASLAALAQQAQDFANDASRSAPAAGRVEVVVGALDPRLRLAPCERAEPYLPAGTRLWGRAHVGVRCVQGRTPWNVYLPVTVKVYARALVAAAALSAGTTLGPGDVVEGEVDLAAESGSVYRATQSRAIVGRVLVRNLAPGQALRSTQLKPRQWFAAGDTVRITASGAGFTVQGSGEALNAGMEGQSARVRTEGGRVVSGTPVGDREMELVL